MLNRSLTAVAIRLGIIIVGILVIYLLVTLMFKLTPLSSNAPPAW